MSVLGTTWLSRVDQTWFLDLVLGGEHARWRVA